MSLLDKASLIVTPNAYKESVLYSVVPNTTLGDMNVVRATTATRVNSAGLIESVGVNVPRIDYTNGSCPSLLVEPQRTNLLTGSNNFVNNWGNDSTSSAINNFSISPDGTQNASRVIAITSPGYSYRITPVLPVGNWTFSIYAKASTNTSINFGINDSGGAGINQRSIALTTNWQRFQISLNITLGTFVVIDYSALQLGINYDFYGAQLEVGSYATSYIPTVATSVTRNADLISKTGISSLIGTTYTVYGEIINEGIHNARHLVLKLPTGGNYTDVVFIVQNFNGLQATANNSTSTAQFTINSGSYSIGQTLKYALRCEQNNVAFYINGVQIGVDTLCTIPAVSTLYLGTYVDLQLGSKIKSTMIFPSALTNDELAQLTTL